MILAFDVGNTETVIGLFQESVLADHWRVSSRTERTVDELGLLVRALLRETGYSPDDVTDAVIGSVVPPVTQLLVRSCEKHLGVESLVVDASTPLPIRLQVDEPLSVGADRIVNTLAATRLYARDTIAVDFGTATTFDCITADGAFIGGVISPGVQTGAEMLVRRTAKLPRADLEPAATVIGTRTETAVRSGIFHGAIEAIDGTVRRIREEWQRPNAFVVATGGLAPLLGPHCRTVDHIEPFLTLMGLEMAFRFARDASSAAD